MVGSFFAYCCFTFCYLERRWTWLAVHPAPGAELLLVASNAEGGGALSRPAADSAYSAPSLHASAKLQQSESDAGEDGERLSQSLL